MRTGIVSFMAPAYAQNTIELLKKVVENAREALALMGINISTAAGPVINLSDVDPAVSALKREDFDFLTALLPSWAEPPMIVNTLMHFSNRPILLWTLSSIKEKGVLIAPAGAAAMSAVMQPLKTMGFKIKMVFGNPDSDSVRSEIIRYAHVCEAVNRLSRSRIGIFGYADMGSYTAGFDQTSLRIKIGPEVEDYEVHRLLLRADEVKDEEADKFTMEQFRGWSIDKEVAKEDIRRAVKVYLALKKIIDERSFSAVSMKCVYGLPIYYGITPCLPLALAGIEIPVVCECDVLGLVTELIMDYISRQRSVYLEFYDIFEDRILMGVCGMIPPSTLEDTPRMYKYAWGKLTGIMTVGSMRTGKITLARVASKGDKYIMHMTVAEAEKPRVWHEIGWQSESPIYPSLEIVLRDKTGEFTEKILAQHYHIVYGDYSKELTELCGILGIELIVT